MAENRQQQIPRCTLMYGPHSGTVEPPDAVPPLASLIRGAAAGPSAAGPSAAGPSAAGPSAAGPSAAGPSAAGLVTWRKVLGWEL